MTLRRSLVAVTAIFLLALVIRIASYEVLWPDRLHGASAPYASAALGIINGEGVTFSQTEVGQIMSNSRQIADFRTTSVKGEKREPMNVGLPGVSYLMAGIWRVTGVYNFRSYVYLQAVLDSLLCILLFSLFLPHGFWVAVTVALGWSLFLPQVRLVCTPGYDFWPGFGAIVGTWSAVTYCRVRIERRTWGLLALILGGIGTGVSLWMREFMLFFPFLLAVVLILLVRKEPRRWTHVLAYLLPAGVFLLTLTFARFVQTGDARPTHGTFWHPFWAGVGQFLNPYGVEGTDSSVRAFAARLNPGIRTNGSYSDISSNEYEETLKSAAWELIRQHPEILVRNALLRSVIVLQPALYTTDEFFASPFQRRMGQAVLWIAFPLQVLGLVYLNKRDRPLLLLLCVPLGSIILALAPFYLVGRALVSIFFVHMGLIALGTKWLVSVCLPPFGMECRIE